VEFQDALDRLVAVASGNETIGVLVELGFKDRGQKPTYHFLGHTVSNHRNAERSKLRLVGAFGDVDAAQGQRPVSSGLELSHECREVLLQVGSEHVDAHLVYARGPAFPLHRLEGLSHELGSDPARQRMHLDLFHVEPFTLCNHEVQSDELWGAFLSMAAVAVSSGCPARARAVLEGISAERLTFLMNSSVVLRLQSVSPFTPRRVAWGYSGSADTLKAEAAKAAFSSPPHCRAFSPVAYRLVLPTVGRRRASPVMTQDHFLQAAARLTRMVHPWQSARTEGGARIGALVSASSRGGDWRTMQAENAVSRSHLAWPLRHAAFSGPPGGDALAA
jgi:hypothetical protein